MTHGDDGSVQMDATEYKAFHNLMRHAARKMAAETAASEAYRAEMARQRAADGVTVQGFPTPTPHVRQTPGLAEAASALETTPRSTALSAHVRQTPGLALGALELT